MSSDKMKNPRARSSAAVAPITPTSTPSVMVATHIPENVVKPADSGAKPDTATATAGIQPATATAAVGSQPGPRRGLPPATVDDLYGRTYWLWDQAWSDSEKHDVIASRWAVLDLWARLILALVAALSAITLLQEQQQLALAFALATAVFSAINAALDPASRSKADRTAGYSYRHVERSAGALLGVVQAKRDTRYVGTPVAGSYKEVMTEAQLKQYGEHLVTLEAEYDEILDKAPPLNRLWTSRPRYPRTTWGLNRMRKRAALRAEADAFFAQQSTQ